MPGQNECGGVRDIDSRVIPAQPKPCAEADSDGVGYTPIADVRNQVEDVIIWTRKNVSQVGETQSFAGTFFGNRIKVVLGFQFRAVTGTRGEFRNNRWGPNVGVVHCQGA